MFPTHSLHSKDSLDSIHTMSTSTMEDSSVEITSPIDILESSNGVKWDIEIELCLYPKENSLHLKDPIIIQTLKECTAQHLSQSLVAYQLKNKLIPHKLEYDLYYQNGKKLVQIDPMNSIKDVCDKSKNTSKIIEKNLKESKTKRMQKGLFSE